MAGTNIPGAALDLYGHREMLRKCRLTLDQTVYWFRYIKSTLSMRESALLTSQLDEVEKRYFEEMTSTLKWSDDGRLS